MHVAPLDTALVEHGFQDLLLWARAADKLLDKYRNALEEIAVINVGPFDEIAGEMQEIAEDALR